MIYGDKKIKNMGRSVLPSTRRKGAKANKAIAHKKARRAVKQNPEMADVVEKHRRHEIRENMWDRRNGDKLSVLRWAKVRAERMDTTDPEERYSEIKKVFPNNLVGRHALSHIFYLDEYYHGNDSYRFSYQNNIASREERAKTRHEFIRNTILARIEQHNGLKNLNRVIKSSFSRPRDGHRMWDSKARQYNIIPCDTEHCLPRTLHGAHDIDSFLSDIQAVRHIDRDISNYYNPTATYHPEVWRAIKKYLGIEDV